MPLHRQMPLTIPRALVVAVIVSIAGAGIPISAAHLTSCDKPARGCHVAMLTASCCCHDAGMPAAASSNGPPATAKMPVATAAPAPASSCCAFPVAARADYALARGRQLISLRILYSSLLI